MITVAGLTPSVDLTYVVDHLELGRIHRPTEVVRRAGGKPLNLARAAAALGADVSIVAVLGGWTGDWLADELARAEIAVHRVTTPVLTRTCVSISAADSDELTELYEYAEPIPADVWTHAREALSAELERPAGLAGHLRRTPARPAPDRPRRAGRARPPRRLPGGRRHPRRLAGAAAAQPAGAGEDQPVRGGGGARRRSRHRR